ncbi:hypothetical protein CRENPOLYSF2_2540006 [Crenothrix polyspora]|uniref:Uncharacterized protein n=1 Tax=Crenothrix polyspora TaxID=360316 RepID=A0A1R4H7U4_9GAMM|nr:hypothetical protein CRENPOLYSF2_2540006 [Crenothrix polyspora]
MVVNHRHRRHKSIYVFNMTWLDGSSGLIDTQKKCDRLNRIKEGYKL